MKKLLIIALVSTCVTVLPAISTTKAENKTQTVAPTKYEIGKYKFNLPEQEAVTVKSITPKATETIQLQQPVSQKAINVQKEIVNQVKKEEQKVQTNVKKSVETVEEEIKHPKEVIESKKTETEKTIKKDVEKIDKKIDKRKDKTEILLETKTRTKSENPIKFDKDRPPVQFKIIPMNYEGKTTTTIEKL